MAAYITFLIVLCAFVVGSKCDPGSPLFLTPYIQNGQVQQAKTLSQVGPITGWTGTSYSGYFTLNPTYNTNMFFWFILAQNNPSSAPLLLWLQGGPGSSDMFGLFVETGPYRVDSNLNLVPNNYSWNVNYNVLYVDNPVGTGWSFTESDAGYVTNEDQVAAGLYEALTQFFTVFPEYLPNEFYVTGESYGGKYIPSIAYKIHVENPTAATVINLKGVAIGNGLIDPVTQNDYGTYLFGLGLIDDVQRDEYLAVQAQMVQLINEGQLEEAFYLFDIMLNGDFWPYGTMFYNYTGFEYYFNYLESVGPDDSYYIPWMQQDAVRSAIHVGNLSFNGGSKVESYFKSDFMNSTKPQVEALIDNGYRVMLYNGQMDLIIPYVFTMTMVESMSWDSKADYDTAERIIWKVARTDVDIAGYAKPADNFVEVLVRNAGHMVPEDQPRVAFDLITRFIENLPWTN